MQEDKCRVLVSLLRQSMFVGNSHILFVLFEFGFLHLYLCICVCMCLTCRVLVRLLRQSMVGGNKHAARAPTSRNVELSLEQSKFLSSAAAQFI